MDNKLGLIFWFLFLLLFWYVRFYFSILYFCTVTIFNFSGLRRTHDNPWGPAEARRSAARQAQILRISHDIIVSISKLNDKSVQDKQTQNVHFAHFFANVICENRFSSWFPILSQVTSFHVVVTNIMSIGSLSCHITSQCVSRISSFIHKKHFPWSQLKGGRLVNWQAKPRCRCRGSGRGDWSTGLDVWRPSEIGWHRLAIQKEHERSIEMILRWLCDVLNLRVENQSSWPRWSVITGGKLFCFSSQAQLSEVQRSGSHDIWRFGAWCFKSLSYVY